MNKEICETCSQLIEGGNVFSRFCDTCLDAYQAGLKDGSHFTLAGIKAGQNDAKALENAYELVSNDLTERNDHTTRTLLDFSLGKISPENDEVVYRARLAAQNFLANFQK